MPEMDLLLGQIVPAVAAAVGACGVSVLTRAEDEAAGATVRLGQRLLDRILHRSADADPVRAAVTNLADAAPNTLASRRIELRDALQEVLRDTPELAAELSALLRERPAVQAGGAHSVALGGDNSGIISTGEGATNTLHQ